MKKWIITAAIIATVFTAARADVHFGSGTSIAFATAAQGREILTQRDDFVQRLSQFDRAARLKTNKQVSEETYLRFVATNVLEWSGREKIRIEAVLAEIAPRITMLSLPWPEKIYLVRTTGKEEGGAAYTRGSAIIIPTNELTPESTANLQKLISHELFHILSRRNPELREKLYAAIGFKPCGEIVFPSKLRSVKITNPDAPKNDHCIHLTTGNTQTWAIPILYSRSEKYDLNRGGEFFDYLQFEFLLVDGMNAMYPSAAIYDDASYRLVSVDHVSGFFDQVGRNTEYIIHPEEILADNFALLVRGDRRVPSPRIQTEMREILRQARTNPRNNDDVPQEKKPVAPEHPKWKPTDGGAMGFLFHPLPNMSKLGRVTPAPVSFALNVCVRQAYGCSFLGTAALAADESGSLPGS